MTPEERNARGINHSSLHTDFMIGSNEVAIHGVTPRRRGADPRRRRLGPGLAASPPTLRSAGRSSAWLERLLWEQKAGGSNPPVPMGFDVGRPGRPRIVTRRDYSGGRVFLCRARSRRTIRQPTNAMIVPATSACSTTTTPPKMRSRAPATVAAGPVLNRSSKAGATLLGSGRRERKSPGHVVRAREGNDSDLGRRPGRSLECVWLEPGYRELTPSDVLRSALNERSTDG